MTDNHLSDPIDGLEVAIIGLSARFPGAANIEEFWKNLRNGVESISAFTEEELQKAGVNRALIGNPAYVKTGAVLDGIDLFDAAFFDYSPREAEIMDPQHRLFLECAWEAIENAGYDSEKYRGTIGVFAGASMNTYLLFNIYPNRSLIESTGDHRIKIANSNDFLATRTSYKLGLEGPSIAVQSACSTSLVAVHLACQSLLNYQSDICLAGAVAVSPLLRRGYMPQEGGVFSPDGHCRAFDVNARGTIGGEGVGVIVLKRLADAIADRDCIHAVIKGSAINNDGSFKIGFTAPREDGQANVIAMALSTAGVDAGTISYVEAHGSGTALGDPIEIAALTQAFRASTDKRRFCAIGSVKSNIGHLDAAAGMAGLIKTVLSLKHKMLPPSLHFEKPNPEIDFDGSPFYVNTELSSWNANGTPRRAGVSSFGIGGTNAHVILEEAPESKASGPSRSHHMLAISAKTESSLERAAERLAAHLKQQPGKSLADVAYTLLAGRRSLPHKRVIVCRDIEQAVNALESRDNQQVMSSFCKSSRRPVAFMFSGLGDHYVNMGRGLYENEPVFREQVDLCSSILRPHLGLGLRDALYPAAQDDPAQADPSSATGRFDLRQMLRRAGPNGSEAAQKLNQTRIAQPAVFVVEYSLAKMWMHWGIQPEALIGYSLGEYVAACLAGVFSLEDALYLVARRAEMIENLPPGVMLAAPLPKAEILQMLNDDLSLSAVNGQKLSVISGH
ncbi:MAG TPA: type I polyketide synthase, partial [Blastocatellia bacterium]